MVLLHYRGHTSSMRQLGAGTKTTPECQRGIQQVLLTKACDYNRAGRIYPSKGCNSDQNTKVCFTYSKMLQKGEEKKASDQIQINSVKIRAKGYTIHWHLLKNEEWLSKGHLQSGRYPTLRGVLFTNKLSKKTNIKLKHTKESHPSWWQTSRIWALCA